MVKLMFVTDSEKQQLQLSYPVDYRSDTPTRIAPLSVEEEDVYAS